MINFIKKIFTPNPKPLIMSNQEVREFFCFQPNLIESPGLFHVVKSYFVIPTAEEFEMELRPFIPPPYSEHMRCKQINRKLVAHLTGYGWPIGDLDVKRVGDKTDHALTSCIIRQDKAVFSIFIDAQTKKRECKKFVVQQGTIA